MREQPSKVLWECHLTPPTPWLPRASATSPCCGVVNPHADEAIAIGAVCAGHPSKEASFGLPVTVFLRQTICLTGIFAEPRVDMPGLAGDGLGRVWDSMRRMR
jgi:hypothetical protein